MKIQDDIERRLLSRIKSEKCGGMEKAQPAAGSINLENLTILIYVLEIGGLVAVLSFVLEYLTKNCKLRWFLL